MDDDAQPPGETDRLLVLKPDPRGQGGAARRTSSGLAGVVVAACIVIGVVVLVLIALAMENWIDERRDARKWAATGRTDPMPDRAMREAPDTPLPRREVPARDRTLAGARLSGNPGEAFGPYAYPAEAIRHGEQGRVVTRLAIDASGTPTRCDVTSSSGSRSLDETTCRIALARVRFTPAHDDKGMPLASSYTLPVRWVLPES